MRHALRNAAHNDALGRAVVIIIGFLLLVVLATNTYQNSRMLKEEKESQTIACQNQYRLVEVNRDLSKTSELCMRLLRAMPVDER